MPKPSSISSTLRFHNVAFGNTGRALITTSTDTTNRTSHIMFDSLDKIFGNYSTSYLFANAVTQASGDGSRLVIGDSNDPVSSRVSVWVQEYPQSINHYPVPIDLEYVSVNRIGTRNILSDNGVFKVYDGDFNLLGILPSSISAAIVNDIGDVAYAYDAANNSVHVFDLNTSDESNGFVELGTPIALTGNPGNSAVMTMSPYSTTLFLAGDQNLVVVNVP